MPDLVLVLGGARSGKSRFAEQLAIESGLEPVYIATAAAGDDEMKERIARHRARRGQNWRTVEISTELSPAISKWRRADRVLLVDCLTLWISNLLMSGQDPQPPLSGFASGFASGEGPVVVVANEVGLGIVPDNPLARSFRDLAGHLNQSVAAAADEVYFVAAGLPLRIKPRENI